MALLDFVGTTRADQSRPEAVDVLRGLGWEDREILEAVLVAGLFHDYNLRVSLLGLELEDWCRCSKSRHSRHSPLSTRT